MKKLKNRSGFSLIELAIVLVVISIIVGVLVGGAEFQRASQVSTIVSEMGYFTDAKNAFMDKYKFRPGDMPATALVDNFPSGTNADNTCSTTDLGDSYWSNDTEEDLAWIQLSYGGFIRQKIDFDPCTAPAYRAVGTHRPESEAVATAGYGFQGIVKVYAYATPLLGTEIPYRYLHVLTMGTQEDSTDTDLSGGALPVTVAREIDAKIDQPNTPFSGRFAVSEDCIDRASGALTYWDEATRSGEDRTCRAYLAEVELGTSEY